MNLKGCSENNHEWLNRPYKHIFILQVNYGSPDNCKLAHNVTQIAFLNDYFGISTKERLEA